MHQIMFPLIIVTVLKTHGSEDHPLSVTQVLDLVNRQYAPFTDRDQVMNRSTVIRTLESLAHYTEVGNLLDFKVVERGSIKKKRYFIAGNSICC